MTETNRTTIPATPTTHAPRGYAVRFREQLYVVRSLVGAQQLARTLALRAQLG